MECRGMGLSQFFSVEKKNGLINFFSCNDYSVSKSGKVKVSSDTIIG